MPTSTRFVVAVETLAMLAERGGRPLRSEDLATAIGTNAAVIRALLGRLAAAGLTMSQLGNGGGALLKRAPGEITLLDAYLAVEDRDIFTFPRSSPDRPGSIGPSIAASLAGPLQAAREAMERALDGVTIAAILAGAQRSSVANRRRIEPNDDEVLPCRG